MVSSPCFIVMEILWACRKASGFLGEAQVKGHEKVPASLARRLSGLNVYANTQL